MALHSLLCIVHWDPRSGRWDKDEHAIDGHLPMQEITNVNVIPMHKCYICKINISYLEAKITVRGENIN